MPKGSAELTNSRREEIITACRKLFQSMSYKEITIKEIAVETSFTRPSIYNYFESKEEIFLALFRKSMSLSPRSWTCSAREKKRCPWKIWLPRWHRRLTSARCCSNC